MTGHRSSTVSQRFTAYLSVEEREDLRQLAREQGTSENYLVRVAVRALLGRSVPPWVQEVFKS